MSGSPVSTGPPARGGAARRAAAFAAGLVVPLLPLLLPAVALMAERRPRLERADLPWLGAIAAYGALSWVHGRWDLNLVGVGLAWLAFQGGRAVTTPPTRVAGFASGVLVGVAALGATAVAQVAVLGFTRAEGPPWFMHTNLFAHAWLVLAVGAATLLAPPAARTWVVLAASLAALPTGSRAALLGIAVVAAVGGAHRRDRHIAATLVGVAVLAVAAAWVWSGDTWAARLLGPFVELTRTDVRPVNLLAGSEDLGDPARWQPIGTDVALVSEATDAAPRTWIVQRTTAQDWARPQQTVRLRAGGRFTLSGEFQVDNVGAPGFLAWGRDEGGVTELRISVAIGDEAKWTTMGRLNDVEARTMDAGGGWTRLEVSFTVAGDRVLALALGPSPDLRSAATGRQVAVRSLQLEAGPAATAYAPSERARAGVGEALARVAIWQVALAGIGEAPWVGHGPDSFMRYYAENGGALYDPNHATPAHAHNQALATSFEGGLVGLLALALLVTALWLRADPWARAALAGLLVANLFDATLLVGVVLFPAAFLAGIRPRAASAVRPERS